MVVVPENTHGENASVLENNKYETINAMLYIWRTIVDVYLR
jgi:hypothetical protein